MLILYFKKTKLCDKEMCLLFSTISKICNLLVLKFRIFHASL